MRNKKSSVIQTFHPNIAIADICSKEQTKKIRTDWIKIYGKNGSDTGMNQFLWHVFSKKAYACLSREQAEKMYQSHTASAYVMMPNDRSENIVITHTKPTRMAYCDVYIFPKNFAWTMAFTHEDDWMGPYFAKHPNYDLLQQDNLKALSKAKAAEYARKKGWVK